MRCVLSSNMSIEINNLMMNVQKKLIKIKQDPTAKLYTTNDNL